MPLPHVLLMMTTLQHLHSTMRTCRLCLAAGHAITPGAVFSGGDGAQVLLIGQAPGVTEVTAKRPFNAGSGTRLFQWLGEAGWDEADFRAEQYMTAVTKCYPGKGSNGKGDRVPSRSEQQLCRPFLDQEIRLVNPRLILLVGTLAIKLLYPAKWKLTQIIGTAVYFPPETLTNPVNFSFKQGRLVSSNTLDMTRFAKNGRFVVPLPHPSGASLWPNKPANQQLIAQAIAFLDTLRQNWVHV